MKPGVRVLTPKQALERFGGEAGQAAIPSSVAIIVAATSAHSVECWSVPSSFPLGLAESLGSQGVKLTVESPFFPMRRCKSAEEIVRIRHGVSLAEAGMEAALDLLRRAEGDGAGCLRLDGEILTSEIVRGEIDVAVLRAGGVPLNTIVAGGVQGADPHEMGTGPLRVGEPVVLDIFPRVARSGYFGDLTRTVVKGSASDVVRRAYAAVAAAQSAATEMIKPGVACREVHERAAAVLCEHGFQTGRNESGPFGFIHGLGHGLGLEIHEAPRLSARSDDVLEPGMVVTVEPGLYYPEWGGVRLENVVAVTESGCEVLTVIPQFLAGKGGSVL